MSNTTRTDNNKTTSPTEISGSGWWDILKRVKTQLSNDHVQIVAAGIAFYFFLAIFPAIAAFVSIYSLIMDPSSMNQQLSHLQGSLPSQAFGLIRDVMTSVSQQSQQALGWSIALSILFSLWSANKGTTAIFKGLNIAYHESDDRSFIKRKAITLGITLLSIVVGVLSLGVIIAFPSYLSGLNLSGGLELLVGVLRWFLLGFIIMMGLSFLYKIGPDRDNPEFRWVSPGAVSASLLWLLGSLLFTWFVNNFGNFGNTYGGFASVIILMLWFFLTAFIILLGAEINAESEHQVRKDSTVGEDDPIGQRDAHYADRVASRNKRSAE
ncbi:YihY/virulence factor BrkB family protein [Zeaxanthinibacter sp. PT1]|uniref:YihY/virulence factor BrkB family protein n=1 Tax=Zeaxanthinibacter TaxID=561554 RepID=UPI00234B6C73|nr:YihY/virulence factor BrkB family protein [Zeaxanthinibacter sp. PT1]MDC6351487.1 YihY/virulence factor BrkB family protein [Zeaxanthinibacter sp. PT1]